ncbi:MAG: hypothetical protein M3463_21795 [Verrucomicrobiota bacterium]|nr:hypothetical protein [Verrucomicrobiota bacterium]
MAREDLNRFEPVQVSKVFKWFEKNFEKAGGVKPVLARYAPERHRAFAQSGGYRVRYLSYRWGLNDQGGAARTTARPNSSLMRSLSW